MSQACRRAEYTGPLGRCNPSPLNLPEMYLQDPGFNRRSLLVYLIKVNFRVCGGSREGVDKVGQRTEGAFLLILVSVVTGDALKQPDSKHVFQDTFLTTPYVATLGTSADFWVHACYTR